MLRPMDAGNARPGTFVASLDARSRAALAELGHVRRFRSGTTLFWEGDRSDHVAVLVSGTVKIEASSDGVNSVLALREPGDLIGELAALDGAPRSAAAIALEPVSARLIPGTAFERFLATEPSAAMALLRLVVARLRDSDRHRVEFGTHGVPGRLARRLVDLAERHGEQDGSAVRITVPLTQQDLAAMIGASREAVARALGLLREHGIVTTQRRSLQILDLEALRRKAL
jgi:CRP/FNR family cyclic AMP-dependent transcriptional regulator